MLNLSHNCKNRRPINKPDETNPKTLPLEKLVQQINPNVLAYYLEQVAAFLKNSKKDLWFPKLSQHLDAFLVRVIKDVQNIKNLLGTFDSKSRTFAEDIIDSLNSNEDVYSLSYSYENSRIEADILVYRKVFIDKGSKEKVTKNSETPYKNPTNPADKPNKDLDWVKATLKFIKDDTWTLIKYPVMSYAEADLAHSVVKLKQTDVSKLGPLCRDLVNAIKVFNKTMELKASFLYINPKEVQLSIEKTPLKGNHIETKLEMPVQSKSNKPVRNNNDSGFTTKTEKVFATRKQLIDSLPKAFINTTLKTILNFISTESEASLVFKNANEKQRLFIQSACAMAKAPKFYSLFASDSVQILRDICKTLTSNQWYELRVDVTKVQSDNSLRTITLVKYPKECEVGYKAASVLKSQDQVDSNKSSFTGGRSKSLDRKNTSKKPIAFERGDKLEPSIGGINKENEPLNSNKIKTQIPSDEDLIDLTTDSETSFNNDENIINNDNKSQQDLKQDKTKPSFSGNKATSTNNSKSNDEKPHAAIDYPKLNGEKSHTRLSRSEIKDNASTDIKRAKSVPPKMFNKDVSQSVDEKRLDISKMRLLNAMSIPMESDIALRMMNQMGWDGGPLGVRGEGITEPIIPALHLAAKAGLGHVELEGKATSGFRLDFLQNVLTLLTQRKTKHLIVYKTPIYNNENKYIVATIKTLNDRKKLNESIAEIRKVLQEIMDKLLCEPELHINCDIAAQSKHVTLRKLLVPTKRKVATFPNDRDIEVMETCKNLPEVITTTSIKGIGSHYSKHKSSKVGLRIAVQYKILEFLKSGLTESTINLAFDVPKKFPNYFMGVVDQINKRCKQLFSYSIENEIYINTLKHAKGTQISVIEYTKRSFTLHKMVLQNDMPLNSNGLSDLANNNSNIANKNKEKKAVDNKKKEKEAVDNQKKEKEAVYTKNNAKEQLKSDFNDNRSNQAGNITDDMKNCTDDTNDTTVDYIFLDKEEIEYISDENNATKNNFIESKDKEVTSTDNISFNSKRNRTYSANSNDIKKKTKMAEPLTYLLITPKNGKAISNDEVRKFQSAIAEQIDVATNLPMLECHGVENGAIVYSCHNDIGAKLIQSVASEMEFATTLVDSSDGKCREQGVQKLKFRLNSFVGVNMKKLFNLIECYNVGLSTDLWAVDDVEVFNGYIVFLVFVDYPSFEYISEAKFRLFAGTDRLRISMAWN